VRGRIFKRGNAWTFVVDVGIRPDGRRKQRSQGGFTTRRAAEENLGAVMNAVASGEYTDPTRLSFEQYVQQEWLPALRATVRPLTLEAYERHCHKYLIPAFGNYPLGGVPVTAINAMYGRLLVADPPRTALSPSTVRRIHATLHKALADAVRRQLIPRNAAAFADPPRASRPETKVWSGAELQTFLAVIRDDRLATLWRFMAFTGVRRGEALGLRWCDLDLERGRATICQTILPIAHRPTVGEPKTARGRRRSVALDRGTVEALQLHLKGARWSSACWSARTSTITAWSLPCLTATPSTPNM
jgi:integrase